MEEDFTVQRLYKQNKVQQNQIKQLQDELEKTKKKWLTAYECAENYQKMYEQFQVELKDLKSMHEGKMDGYHEVVVQKDVEIQQLQVENKKLKHTLNKSEVVLFNYNPKDEWFPQIEQQFSELMDEIHHLLRKPKRKEGSE